MGGKNLSSTLVGDVIWEVIQSRIKMRFTVATNESSISDVQGWFYTSEIELSFVATVNLILIRL